MGDIKISNNETTIRVDANDTLFCSEYCQFHQGTYCMKYSEPNHSDGYNKQERRYYDCIIEFGL